MSSRLNGMTATPIKVTVVFPVSTRTEFLETVRRDYGYIVTGHGPQQSTEAVASSIVRCLRRPRPEVYPLAFSRGLTVFNTLTPGFCDRFVQRYKRKVI